MDNNINNNTNEEKDGILDESLNFSNMTNKIGNFFKGIFSKMHYSSAKEFIVGPFQEFVDSVKNANSAAGTDPEDIKKPCQKTVNTSITKMIEKVDEKLKKFSEKHPKFGKIFNLVLRVVAIVLALAFGFFVVKLAIALFPIVLKLVAISCAVTIISSLIMRVLNKAVGIN